MTSYLPALLTTLLSLAPISVTAKIYKWTDENGQVHFSDKKIESVEQEVIKPRNHTSSWSRYDISVKTIDTNLSKQELNKIVADVNLVYEFYDRVLFFDFYKTVPVKILILKDEKAYYDYLRKQTGREPSRSYGKYLYKGNQIVVYIQKDRARTFRTIKHEVSHAITDTVTPYAQSWLNEGLAEQMETLSKVEGQLRITSHWENYKWVNPPLRHEKLMEIGTFIRLPNTKWRHEQRNGSAPLQAQAGQFIYFLLSKPTGKSFVIRLMHKLERGNRTHSYYLVDKDYIGGIKGLEIDWRNWLRGKIDKHITF
ncbi:DUF4124 domain-containing protein [Microbulbifer sp. THAF38]|uniref:DUF4124 domain-containing protein n=1 Tax=Microbulbifer sp. THAF38 TaxID=2587856 RepID=UPI00126927CC|nr:DUF4124 domain-containing protein [Microbulbifer sp. THAF38]QFT53644.1 hypothetical protein FIU95_03525 [Microbulbifer sp. THAF38]